ncbi:MAG: hypothetical protein HC871_00850 [Rhizobiales bacterium]|nr:hypothetical protein [Hyphomicrobiales bacterium]
MEHDPGLVDLTIQKGQNRSQVRAIKAGSGVEGSTDRLITRAIGLRYRGRMVVRSIKFCHQLNLLGRCFTSACTVLN